MSNHIKANLHNIKLVECLYHRTYMTVNMATLEVSIDGVKHSYKIRNRAAKRDALYHSNGIKCILVTYDDIVLAYEIIKDDAPASPTNMMNIITQYGNDDDWYFDTERFYKLDATPSDKFFSLSPVSAIDPIHITYSSSADVVFNDAFIICKDNKIIYQSHPIRSDMERLNKKYLLTDMHQDVMYLTLGSLLKVCRDVSNIYGGEEIERFDLPQYMIRFKTVNLSKLPVNVKEQAATNVKPFEIIIYLLGLVSREKDSHNAIKLTKLIRHVCSFGIINYKITDQQNVFKEKTIEIKRVEIKSE